DSTPFGLTNVGSDSAPSFADIDGDGDLDAFIGEENGNINYFENTSTNGSVPAFRFSNDSEPFGLTDVGDYAAPSFADIDGDGDLDAFIGEGDGNVNYFENNSAQRSTAVETVTLDETFSCPENTTLTYATTNLGSGISACDLDGDAIYAASVLPTGQGVSAAVVGTGANDCELMVEISLTNNVLPDDYTISLVIEDPDGVSNSSGTSSAINSAGTVLSLNLGTFEVQGCGIIVDAISIATPIVSRNQTATFLNVDLESDGCDANGNAIYSTLISPNTPQSPIINVVGTGAGDCEFTVEVITDSNTAPADYDISLVIEDPDGVNNESAVGSVSGSTSTFVTFEPQALSVVPTASPVVEASDITINNNRSCQDETTTFSTVTLTTDQCDFDGDAIYTATIVPAGQGVTAAVVGTGADDCSFTVEITTSASATLDEYAVNLVVEDADGVSNTSAQTNVIQTNNQSISYNLGTFKVLGDVDVTTIYGAEVVAANSVSDFAVNILNTNPNTTYIWTVDGTALTTMIGDGDHTGSPQNIDIGSGNSVNVSAVTIAVADNITQSVLTIDNPQDGPMQDINFSLQATNPCGVDTEMATTAVTILPVELLYFKATAQATSTLLTWETAFEQNNDYFSIERSYDARTFEPIGQVQGVGTSIQAQQYEFIDRTVDVSQEQVYYRLRQVDYDQSYMYTDIKVVAFAQDEVFLELSPNPTSNQLVIKNGMGKANITNALGQVVKTFVIDSKVFTLDVNALASGQYILTVEQWNGTIAIEQFVK
ncbi:MAG: T9SS type A sorting domain-containing protein, partial [Bacteroidota bacterium]